MLEAAFVQLKSVKDVALGFIVRPDVPIVKVAALVEGVNKQTAPGTAVGQDHVIALEQGFVHLSVQGSILMICPAELNTKSNPYMVSLLVVFPKDNVKFMALYMLDVLVTEILQLLNR